MVMFPGFTGSSPVSIPVEPDAPRSTIAFRFLCCAL